MTILNDTKDENDQVNSYLEEFPSNEDGQILHLKRLLVTLKQHYEKNVHTLHVQLQAEQNQRIALQKDLDFSQRKILEQQNLCEKIQKLSQETSSDFENEIKSLQGQLAALKEILKKTQEENKFIVEQQFEKASSLNKMEKETSEVYRQDLESIKSTFIQGVQEAKAIEIRYIEVLNEKIGLEHIRKNLEQEIQQLNLFISQLQQKIIDAEALSKEEMKKYELRIESLQIQIETNEREKQQLEYSILSKQNEIECALKQIEELQRDVEHQETLNALVKEQDALIQEQGEQLHSFEKDYQQILVERDHLRNILEDSENRLKVSQQHLAKKVKEAALLAERIEEQEINLNDLMQTLTHQKTQMAQLQGTVEFQQKEEKRLQDQLHESLKNADAQVSKWEEKYFQIHEKWQSGEELIRKLKKIEEKYEQMRGMLANIGAFVGNGIPSMSAPSMAIPSSSMHVHPLASEAIEPPVRQIAKETLIEEPIRMDSHQTEKEEKVDLFGMRQSAEYYKQNFLYER